MYDLLQNDPTWQLHRFMLDQPPRRPVWEEKPLSKRDAPPRQSGTSHQIVIRDGVPEIQNLPASHLAQSHAPKPGPSGSAPTRTIQVFQRLSVSGWMPSPTWHWHKIVEDLELTAECRQVTNMPQLYPLSLPQLFYAGSDDVVSKQIYHWVRLRDWCISQAIHPTADGRSYTAPLQLLPADVMTHFSPDDIARLPKPLDAHMENMLGNRRCEADGADRGSHQRLQAERVNIAVRFTLEDGFTPYTEDMKPLWGDESITLVHAGEFPLRAEVTWELCLLSFQLKLLNADRVLALIHYLKDDMLRMADARDKAIRLVDKLMSSDWHVRQEAVLKWAEIMRDWPGGEEISEEQWLALAMDLSDYEGKVITFYCKSFHQQFGRMPVIPLCQPESMDRHVKQHL
ncbi:uncharacterized protein LAESUDRAFT_715820 [Laetiporus sulphureus 93-53]|uniref:Uncharacterized protein n=1 Tax=Laetiporus sulphureus 93-53 TaxID=1314785 RepID=A0A165D409_9APHY|nr:uncharacterized protein LAESUDRAFT_715820 [Laetiporus sulphureus 93-53]KZT04111.1 hypothetical protein LAESUDRAFT_715820 [Laetiporus sulphureus 93-53]